MGALWLLRLQGWAAIAWALVDRANGAFLSGARLEHVLRQFNLGSDGAVSELARAALASFAVGWWLLGAAVLVGLCTRRWRNPAIAGGILWFALHTPIVPTGVYAMTGATLILCWLDPDWVEDVWETVLGRARTQTLAP